MFVFEDQTRDLIASDQQHCRQILVLYDAWTREFVICISGLLVGQQKLLEGVEALC